MAHWDERFSIDDKFTIFMLMLCGPILFILDVAIENVIFGIAVMVIFLTVFLLSYKFSEKAGAVLFFIVGFLWTSLGIVASGIGV